MRRPLKPFVTEYKVGNRRAKDGTAAFGVQPEGLAPDDSTWKAKTKAAKPNSADAQASEAKNKFQRNAKGQTGRQDSPRETNWANDTARFASAQADGSYEAAVRAADALFSGAYGRSSSPASEASTDQVFTNGVSPKPTVETSSPGGRILRVIDEPQDTALADLEVERAPKRRGRKPGSKNKPKIQMVPQDTGSVAPIEEEEDDATGPSGEWPPEPLPSSAPRLFVPCAFPIVVPSSARRFAWVRTKLGPGEQWKRRLPKVIW